MLSEGARGEKLLALLLSFYPCFIFIEQWRQNDSYSAKFPDAPYVAKGPSI